ncbi:hypothetical protein [Propionivibrio sp.]|uniref:hypothetical protein n=1 Tax=Propionivibrio sp. TaxID=2212460 RepID=UPI00272DF72A|nr:hypothetical protein [Propionivibrio sp.]
MANPKIEIEISARLDALDRQFSSATRMAHESAKRMEASFSGIGSALSRSFGGFALGATVAAGAAMVKMSKDVVDAGDALAKMSVRTGIAVEELSKLQYAASLSDVSNEDLAGSLGRLNKVLGEAADGSKEATAALARFGIAPGATNAAEAFAQIADRVKNTSDQTKIASAMNDVFGRSWATLVPMIKNGSDGLKEAGDELERMGGVISGDLAKSSEQFNDNLTRLNKTFDAMKIAIGNDLVPWLTKLSNEFLSARKAGLTFWESVTELGLSNPFKSAGDQIVGITKQIEDLRKKMSGEGMSAKRIADFGLPDYSQEIKQLEKVREYYKTLNNLSVDSVKDRWMPQVTGAEGITGTSTTSGRAKNTKADDPLADFLSDLEARLKPAEQALEAFRQMQLDAAVSSADLTAAEKKLYDLINSPEWATMADPWKVLVTAQFEAANSAEKAATEQAKLTALLAATPTAKQQELVDITILLDKAFKDGRISAEQLSEAVSAAAGTATDSMQQATDTINTFAEQAARNMQDALADFLFDPFDEGLDGMLKGFGETLQKMIAQAVAADIAKKVFGKAGGGEGEGLLGAGLNWVSGLFANADGGVYASPGLSAYSGQVVSRPTVFPFASGIGLMGEAGPEAILPLKRGSDGKLGVSSGGSPVNITVNVTGTTAPDVRRAAGQGAREALAALNSAQRYR